MMEETKVRLRASCNGCNESKVRCSQHKPTCSRCERNEVECIYGLSRRTHKDAPPISIPASQRGRKAPWPSRPSRPASSGDAHARTNTSSGTNSDSPRRKRGTPRSGDCVMADEAAEASRTAASLVDDCMFLTASDADPMHSAAHMLDFTSLLSSMTDADATIGAPGYFSAMMPTPPCDLDSMFCAPHDPDDEGECTCHADVTGLLSSMRGGPSASDHRLSIDAHLAKLKQCIAASEMSMACGHGRDDDEPLHIMAVAMLIGHVIDDFKMLATESSLRRSSPLPPPPPPPPPSSVSVPAMAAAADMGAAKSAIATPSSLGDSMEPRLSWGVLELEEDDEMDLRQRLYQLSFRKLERLLSQLTMHLRDLHSVSVNLPDPSQHMSFVIACDYTRLWLERKAGDVKRLLLSP